MTKPKDWDSFIVTPETQMIALLGNISANISLLCERTKQTNELLAAILDATNFTTNKKGHKKVT